MRRWSMAAGILALILMTPLSCRQLYTTSLLSGAKRNASVVTGSSSTGDLVSVASTDGADKQVAADVLNALATKSSEELTALSTGDKTTVLDLATTATTDMATLTDIASQATDGTTDTKALVGQVLDSFDSSVNLTAITTILADTTTTDTAPVDTIVLASAAVVANVADSIGTEKTMQVLASGDTTGLTPEQKTKIELVIGVRTKLQTDRTSDLENTSIGGFNLSDLLKGNI